jgi:predicted transcriptional regulator
MDRREATDAEAKALASSLRLRILRVCLDEARTNKETADILGRDPATILHHVRTLVRTGFLKPQQRRALPGGGREIPYLATQKSWQIGTPAQHHEMVNTFVEELAVVRAEDVDAARLGLRLAPGDMSEFRAALRTLLDEFADRPTDPSAQAWSVFVAVHPDPNRP